MNESDYIIVGGGTAGCVVAARPGRTWLLGDPAGSGWTLLTSFGHSSRWTVGLVAETAEVFLDPLDGTAVEPGRALSLVSRGKDRRRQLRD